MTYELEAVITCDECGAGMAYAGSKHSDWRYAKMWLGRPEIRDGDGQTVPCKGGDKHLCRKCKEAA